MRLEISPAIAAAIAAGRPVVALETTLVTHGLPHPDGLQTAVTLEDEVRANGATPATIGILDGLVRVGLTRGELDALAGSRDVVKTNSSNLGAVAAAGGTGSTTVAATMAVAHRAGIRVVATGGIGGVHRGVEQTGDVSADLVALGRVPVAVVSAGAKAILDLPRTIEMLETLGVPVLGYQTSEFPAFYSRRSGLRVDARVESIAALAAAIAAHWALGLASGVLVANPIPAAEAIDDALYERALATALSESARAGVTGRDVTPFLLDRLRDLTGGETVRANLALLRHNARVAAQLSVALAAAAAARS